MEKMTDTKADLDSEKELHLIAEMPTEIADYLENEGDPEAVEIEDEFTATFDHGEHMHYFILCTAALPVKEYESNLGFGLWVEVTKEDFEKFIDVQEKEEEYAKFACSGTLANDWPLFDHTIGDEVQIKVLGAEFKPQIVSIDTDSDELKKYIETDSLDEAAKAELRARIIKLVEED